MPDGRKEAADWLQPPLAQSGARRYLQTLRERAWLVVLTLIVTTAAAVVYVATADKEYQAEADVLISPVPSEDTLLAGLALLRDSADPVRDVETAARLITARDVEERVERKLDVENPDVTAQPVAESNIVTITATASDSKLAPDLANGFARTAIEERTKQFQEQLDQAVKTLRARVGGGTATTTQAAPGSPADQLARLEALRGSPDPTLRLETPATAPQSASWPKPKLTIAAGIVAGLILGIGGVFGLQLLDPRLRREEELRALYNLPVLARIPAERRRGKSARDRPIPPQELSPTSIEAFRSLRFAVDAAQGHREGPSSIFVTGASPSEGKTTVSINLAVSLALTGESVIVIEADLRRPGVGKALGIAPPREGIVSVLLERTPLEEALTTPEGFRGNLRLLLAEESDEWLADRLSLPAARKLVSDAKELAHYVIIDSPPLIEVTDAMPLAQRADDVLLVVRQGRSNLDRLTRLGELLAHQGMKPVGLVLVGISRPRRSYYYYQPEEAPWRRELPDASQLEDALRETSGR